MRISVQQAAHLLNEGHVVGVPTETVYGLAASLIHPSAIARIFQLKGRPANNPLIIHVAHVDDIAKYVEEFPPGFDHLATTFWPGPMTLVIPVKAGSVDAAVRAHLPTAAFRIPVHPLARELLAHTGPLVMPSANLSGKPSSTCAEHVEHDFGLDFPVLDGGACLKGMESTILFFKEGKWCIIRLGAVEPEAFESVLGYIPDVLVKEEGSAPICPGQLYRHYAPKAKLILSEGMPAVGMAVLGFSDRIYPEGCRVLSLGDSHDPNYAAHHLYALLRQLDEEGIVQAWVDMNFPGEGLWQTVRERLYKAASLG